MAIWSGLKENTEYAVECGYRVGPFKTVCETTRIRPVPPARKKT